MPGCAASGAGRPSSGPGGRALGGAGGGWPRCGAEPPRPHHAEERALQQGHALYLAFLARKGASAAS